MSDVYRDPRVLRATPSRIHTATLLDALELVDAYELVLAGEPWQLHEDEWVLPAAPKEISV